MRLSIAGSKSCGEEKVHKLYITRKMSTFQVYDCINGDKGD
jgi:hypothetical protein